MPRKSTRRGAVKRKAVVHPAKLVRAEPVRPDGIDAARLRRIQVQNRIRATVTGTRIFDRTVHKTNIWLRDVMLEMGWDNRERAYSALRATLHALRDILTVEEVVQLGAQLPILLRGIYYEGWTLRRRPYRLKRIAEFHDLVRHHLGPGMPKFRNNDIRNFTQACLNVLTKHVGMGEMKEVKGILPLRLRSLIPLSMDDLDYRYLA